MQTLRDASAGVRLALHLLDFQVINTVCRAPDVDMLESMIQIFFLSRKYRAYALSYYAGRRSYHAGPPVCSLAPACSLANKQAERASLMRSRLAALRQRAPLAPRSSCLDCARLDHSLSEQNLEQGRLCTARAGCARCTTSTDRTQSPQSRVAQ